MLIKNSLFKICASALVAILLSSCGGDTATNIPTTPTITAEIKKAFGADPTKSDTDGDGLTDEFEIKFGYPTIKPDNKDTNGNGKSDADEDSDGDGLSNLQEQQYQTNPLLVDTDGDGLTDGDEVNKYKTDPTKLDTDGDGIPDGREVANGSDPIVPDAEKVVRSLFLKESPNFIDGTINRVTVTVLGAGDRAADFTSKNYADIKLPGQVSRRYDITLKDSTKPFSSASVTLQYDAKLADASDPNDLAVYSVNPSTGFWEELPSVVNPTFNTVTGTTTHFSEFVVKKKSAFNQSIAQIKQTCDAVSDPNAKPADVVLVIDSSGSMVQNDPSNLRLTAARNFVQSMKSTDRVAVVDFDSAARTAIGFSNNKTLISNAIGTIDSSGGTDIGAGIQQALSLFSTLGSTSSNKAVILLTDGDGPYTQSLTTQMANQGIRAFTIGLTGAVKDVLLISIADGTQGGYKKIADASGLVGIFSQFASVFGDTGVDTDGDGLTDCQEVQGIYVMSLGRIVKTDPLLFDSDSDGFSDSAELGPLFKAPLVALSPYAAKGFSDPMSKDGDGDGIEDADEYRLGTNPLSADSDGDGLKDNDELTIHGTDPSLEDTDGDGLSDGVEISKKSEGYDPLVIDYKNTSAFRSELWEGFIYGDSREVDTVPKVIGQVASGLLVFGDIRDYFALMSKGENFGAAITAVGLIPAGGDIVKTAAIAKKFVTKSPSAKFALTKQIAKVFGSNTAEKVAKEIGETALELAAKNKKGIWLTATSASKRGKDLEVVYAARLTSYKKLFGNYPKIDAFEEASKTALSVKSIDFTLPSYRTPGKFAGKIRSYAKELVQTIPTTANPIIGKVDDVVFEVGNIQKRQLDVLVPGDLIPEYKAVFETMKQEFPNVQINLITDVF
jgi:von Willebrand factor type A domain/Bacterial TSP3 repeat